MPRQTSKSAARIALFALLSGACGSHLHAHEFSGPQGTVVVDWSVPNVSRIVSAGYGDTFGIEAAVKSGFPEPLTIDGRACVDGSFFLFDVDDEFAFDIDETVTVEILFDRSRSTGFWISYDRNALAEPLQEIRFAPSTERWHRHTIELERARFANRGESGSDFAIAALSAMWPGIPGADHRVVICDVQITRSNSTVVPADFGELALHIRGDRSQLTPARIGLYDASGRMPLPSADALTIRNYDDLTKQVFLRSTHGTVSPWPHTNRHFFYVDGTYEARLPAGEYRLVVSKGPEFALHTTTLDIRNGETTTMDVALARWTDMPARGWYSGDDHVHMVRQSADNEAISAVMQAEDVHVTNLLQMGNPYDTHFGQYAFGEAGRYLAGRHALVAGVEDPRTAVRGHTISLNIREPVRPADRYLQYERTFAAYRQQGGMSGYAHVAGELFNVARGLAVDVPLGSVDFIEILQDGILATGLWYDFLNLGFKLTPTAGSDFPYLGAPGAERNYVFLGDAFSTDAWYAALRNNRTFVTNGPMLEFTVNGQPMGADLQVASGDEILVRASAALNPDIEALDRLELVVHGELVASTRDPARGNALTLEHRMIVRDGIWLAVRAYGVDQAAAHSAPIFVSTGHGFGNSAKVADIARTMLERLDEFALLSVDAGSELEPWSVAGPLSSMFEQQRADILERADAARNVYLRMLDRRVQ